MATDTKRRRTPVIRIGIDLDQIIVTEDGILLPDGFSDFIRQQREEKRELLLYGCFGDEIIADLEALKLFEGLDADGLGFAREDLRLFADDAAKHADIRATRLSHYIAGDLDIFASKHFTRRAQPILFSYMISDEYPTFADWVSVNNYLNWYRGLRKQTRSQLRLINPIKEYGDNFIYKLHTTSDEAFILKRYYEKMPTEHDRLQTEVRTLNALKNVGIDHVPQPLWHDGKDWVVFNYVEGKDMTDADDNEVKQLADFLITLDQKGQELKSRRLPVAEDARLTLSDYINGIKRRWNPIMNAVQRHGPQDAMLFMMTDLEQLRQDNINHFYLWCKRKNWDQEKPLPMRERILAPGDFGIHNAIRRPDGELVFVDFEFSGWDDPAKLMADFFYNTAQNLDMEKKLKVLDAFTASRDWDENFLHRFWAVSDLVAVEWILRRLAIVVPSEQHRLMLANPNVNIPELIKKRLAEAEELRKNYTPMERLCKHVQLIEDDSELQ